MRAKRGLGQHFLTDPRLLGRIADAVGAGRDDTVLEIGPGPGGREVDLAEEVASALWVHSEVAHAGCSVEAR